MRGDINCEGGNALPLERDVSISKSYLKTLEKRYTRLTGIEKGTVARNIKTQKRRLEIFDHRTPPSGIFYLNTVCYTDFAEKVEKAAHKYLHKYLDDNAPMGEVFSCSVAKATLAVELALADLGLLSAVRKEIEDYRVAPEYGECPICGKYLCRREICLDCSINYNS
jgi:hypothetical protein